MKVIFWIWYGPYWLLSFGWEMVVLFAKHHLEHWRYTRAHRSHEVRMRLRKSRFWWWL